MSVHASPHRDSQYQMPRQIPAAFNGDDDVPVIYASHATHASSLAWLTHRYILPPTYLSASWKYLHTASHLEKCVCIATSQSTRCSGCRDPLRTPDPFFDLRVCEGERLVYCRPLPAHSLGDVTPLWSVFFHVGVSDHFLLSSFKLTGRPLCTYTLPIPG